MNREEHISTAQELMKRADEEWKDGGNDMIAAELLWGALVHCLITVALNENLPHDSHWTFRTIVRYLDSTHGGNTWSSRFGAAEQLHFRYYHGDLTATGLNSHRRQAQAGTTNLLQSLQEG